MWSIWKPPPWRRWPRNADCEFAAIKSISDDAEFEMPPLNRFIDDGKFDTRRFLVYVALHPRWWGTLGKIKKNSEIASANLCRAVEHLIESSCQ